jgi:hypothetical protein
LRLQVELVERRAGEAVARVREPLALARSPTSCRKASINLAACSYPFGVAPSLAETQGRRDRIAVSTVR